MRNIFLFIRRYFNLLAFLALQYFALSFLFRYNKFHRAVFLGIANEITGRVNTQYNVLDDYFHLKEENTRVHRMNDSLMNLLKSNFMTIDTGSKLVVDSTRYDTLAGYRRYLWREAKVINNSVNEQKNYLQINRGANHGIKDNMAVINSDWSAVGVVVNVSENFSQVMSLLHVQSKVNASLKKTGDFGTIEWDGKDPRYLTLKGIPKSIPVQKGDTVLTSIYSSIFPPGMRLGTVDGILDDKSTNFYVLTIKTAANFYNLQQVFVVENLQREEQVKLSDETSRKIDQVKKLNR
jgi:rod shape-determining protein MreC